MMRIPLFAQGYYKLIRVWDGYSKETKIQLLAETEEVLVFKVARTQKIIRLPRVQFKIKGRLSGEVAVVFQYPVAMHNMQTINSVEGANLDEVLVTLRDSERLQCKKIFLARALAKAFLENSTKTYSVFAWKNF